MGLIVGNFMVQSTNNLVAANVSVKRIEVTRIIFAINQENIVLKTK